MNKPKRREVVAASIIITACEDYMDFIESPDWNEDEVNKYEIDIFEKALEAVFGEDVFDYINKKHYE